MQVHDQKDTSALRPIRPSYVYLAAPKVQKIHGLDADRARRCKLSGNHALLPRLQAHKKLCYQKRSRKKFWDIFSRSVPTCLPAACKKARSDPHGKGEHGLRSRGGTVL